MWLDFYIAAGLWDIEFYLDPILMPACPNRSTTDAGAAVPPKGQQGVGRMRSPGLWYL